DSKGFLGNVLPRLLKSIADAQNNVLLFETPEVIDRDKFGWIRDEEFCRQTLAGLNPLSITLVTEWPIASKLDPEVYGPPESAITKEVIERQIKGYCTLEEALENKKLFMLDYHDVFLPYVNKVRDLTNLKTTLYGSRTLMYLTPTGTLRPLAIELVRPPGNGKPQWKRVFTPCWDATGAWLWKLAKMHALAHDSGYHQLVSHWGMAVEDPDSPHGLKLTVEDYPYANDGLILWDIIKDWVTNYVNHYYPEENLVESDKEIQEWWTEIRTKGHADKKDEPWWPVLKTPQDLIGILTTIIWVASGHHAAVNFGQYDYAGYIPNRATIARVKMPCEDPTDDEWEAFKRRPEDELLSTYPS
ncbi:linoleate 13S-lipoxygenase 2-1, chloroplastic-like protein, partial [Tanacetum coccineum]